MRVLYLSPGHHSHDDQFVQAIAAIGADPVVRSVASPSTELIARILEEVRPQVVHAGPINTIARCAAEAGAQGLVAVSWGFDLLGDEKSAPREKTAWTLAHSECLVVDCEASARVAIALGMPSDRIFRLPWGVDLATFRLSSAASAPWRKGQGWEKAVVVVTARAHEPQYGVDQVIDAFSLAAKDRGQLRLLVFGEGSLTPQLKRQAEGAGVADLVLFAGCVPPSQLAEGFGASDIYVSASSVDGSSVTLLEAMAMRLPSVVSDIPGNREWVTPDSGVLFPRGDRSALARALISLADDPRRRAAAGVAARLTVEMQADWQANRAILRDVYAAANDRPRRS